MNAYWQLKSSYQSHKNPELMRKNDLCYPRHPEKAAQGEEYATSSFLFWEESHLFTIN